MLVSKIIDRPIIDIMNDLKTERLDVEIIDKHTKERCTEFLISKGYEDAQVAKFLLVSERTVRRYVFNVRKSHSLSPSIELSKTIIGNFELQTQQCIRKLFKICSDPTATFSEQIKAIKSISSINKDKIDKMQKLGYLSDKNFEEMSQNAKQLTQSNEAGNNLREITGNKEIDTAIVSLSPTERTILRKSLEEYVIAGAEGDEVREAEALAKITEVNNKAKKPIS